MITAHMRKLCGSEETLSFFLGEKDTGDSNPVCAGGSPPPAIQNGSRGGRLQRGSASSSVILM